MKIAGTYSFPASREEVWAALNDPEVLARSIPGCQKLEQVGEHEFESTLKVGLQAVKGVYSGRVKIDDLQPPTHYRIAVDGKGTNGFMKGGGTIDLEEDGDNTRLVYAGEAQVGGTIASVGQRLIDGASKTLISQSLKALAAQIEARKKGGKSNSDVVDTPGLNDTSAAPSKAPSGPADEGRSNDYAKNAVATMEPREERALANETTASGGGSTPEPAIADAGTTSTTAPAQQAAAAPPATTTLLSTNPVPPSPTAAAPAAEAPQPGFQRRSIVVPEHEQLSEAAVVQGMVVDFVSERPWLPWVIIAFLLGYVFGKRG